MTSISVNSPAVAQTDVAVERGARGLAVRRWFIIASPVLAGLLTVLGAATDPGAGIDGRALYQLYADNPGPLQIHTLGLHWAFAFFAVPALFLAGYVRGRGVWLANVAAFLGFVGISTIPGLLFIDFYDSAIGQLYGADGAVAVSEELDTMWGVVAFAAPAGPALLLCLPLAIAAMWRAGLVKWWAFAAALAGVVAVQASGVVVWGAVAMTVCFAVLSVALAVATRDEQPSD